MRVLSIEKYGNFLIHFKTWG